MAINFATAGTIKSVKPAKKSDRPEVSIADLEDFAALDAAIKSMTALKGVLEGNIKASMKSHFVEAGCDSKSRPVNFRGIDGAASASCELRARSSASSLSAEEQELLAKFSIPMRTDTVVAETLVINPAYLGDADLLAKVQTALNGVEGIPDDFILKQDGVSKTVVDGDALEVLFATGDEETAAALLPVVGTLAIKPVLSDSALAYGIVGRLLAGAASPDAGPARQKRETVAA